MLHLSPQNSCTGTQNRGPEENSGSEDWMMAGGTAGKAATLAASVMLFSNVKACYSQATKITPQQEWDKVVNTCWKEKKDLLNRDSVLNKSALASIHTSIWTNLATTPD